MANCEEQVKNRPHPPTHLSQLSQLKAQAAGALRCGRQLVALLHSTHSRQSAQQAQRGGWSAQRMRWAQRAQQAQQGVAGVADMDMARKGVGAPLAAGHPQCSSAVQQTPVHSAAGASSRQLPSSVMPLTARSWEALAASSARWATSLRLSSSYLREKHD